jgi:hypothetical protein
VTGATELGDRLRCSRRRLAGDVEHAVDVQQDARHGASLRGSELRQNRDVAGAENGVAAIVFPGLARSSSTTTHPSRGYYA